MDQIEKLEQEHFKRMSFSKKEMNKIRENGKLQMQDNNRLDQFDDLRDIENILGTKRPGKGDGMDSENKNERFGKKLKSYIQKKGSPNKRD